MSASEGMRFTKGPWWFDRDDDEDGTIYYAVNSKHGTEHRPGFICNVYSTKEDAALIAAAPDMAHALKIAREAIHALHNLGIPPSQRDELWRIYQQSPEMKCINAALSKAGVACPSSPNAQEKR